jgi:Sec7-like guanine-nucleotide exchange factor
MGMEGLPGMRRGTLVVREAPGALLVTWAESQAGAVALERTYTRSSGLDGDAVIVFMRALCAVSQEELEAGGGRSTPGVRFHTLQKVVECAYHNMSRIRFVWAKLWSVIAAQLVGASCHPDKTVALHAVNALRQLVAKLLARAELAHFTAQEEALRPFVAVLRQSDEVAVRELAAQCVMQVGAMEGRHV